jgi:hypothetical protein
MLLRCMRRIVDEIRGGAALRYWRGREQAGCQHNGLTVGMKDVGGTQKVAERGAGGGKRNRMPIGGENQFRAMFRVNPRIGAVGDHLRDHVLARKPRGLETADTYARVIVDIAHVQ